MFASSVLFFVLVHLIHLNIAARMKSAYHVPFCHALGNWLHGEQAFEHMNTYENFTKVGTVKSPYFHNL